jgi:hypothetical protein
MLRGAILCLLRSLELKGRDIPGAIWPSSVSKAKKRRFQTSVFQPVKRYASRPAACASKV